MEWSIQFYYDEKPNSVFINEFFNFLICKGVKYSFKGGYSIHGKDIKNIHNSEKETKESTEKLPEIICDYLKHDLNNTHLDVVLNYVGEVNYKFSIYIIPIKNKCFISFEAGEHLISDKRTFLSFVNLSKELFNRLNFGYGAFRTQYQDDIPFNEQDFLRENPDIVNFYSYPLVNKIGREKLLSTPAFKVEELENGGLMLLVCAEPLGCPEEIRKVCHHLGYD